MSYDNNLSPAENLKLAGYTQTGQLLDEPKDEYSNGGDRVDHFGAMKDALAMDDDAREEISLTDDDGFEHAIKRTEAERDKHLANGDSVRTLESICELNELNELRALSERKKAREALNVHEIFNGKLTAAVMRGDWRAVADHLIAAIVDDKSDHAAKVSCTKARIEISALVGDDTGEDFNGAWLSRITGLPLRTAQDLIASTYSVEDGLATLLIGTEHGGRKAFRQVEAMTPARRSAATAALKESLTLHLLECAAKREKAQRTRSVSLSELKALSAIGLNNTEGWTALTELSVSEGKKWLATALDKAEAMANREGGAVAKGFDVIGAPVGRVRPSLTMQMLANERIYSL